MPFVRMFIAAGTICLVACGSNVALGQEAEGDQLGAEPIPTPRALRPLHTLGVDAQLPAGIEPRDYAAEQIAAQSQSGATAAGIARDWPIVAYRRAAAGSRSYPLYFEEVNAERYGYTCSRCLQPAISAAHFFGTIPYLPYLMTANCPRECVYTLGHYRPGSCNPWREHSFPYRCDAAVVQGAAVAGLIFLIP